MPRFDGGAIRYTLEQIPAGRAGTDATVRRMAELVNQALADQAVRMVALRILQTHQAPPGDQLQTAGTLYEWVKQQIRYVRDPVGLETVQSPEVTLQLRAGDCDDSTTLIAALATAVGLRVRFVTVGPHQDAMQHVYAQLLVNGAWLNADTTTPGTIGKPDPRMPAVRFYSVEGKRMSGLYAAATAAPITKEALWHVAYTAAKKMMRDNWRDGLVNRADLEGYVRVIDEGNSPLRGTFADSAMRQAALDVLQEKNDMGESAPKGEMAELGDMGFFLGSVVKFVAGAVGKAVSYVTGGSQPQIVVNPPAINIPSIQTQVTPETARAGVGAFLSNPIVLVGGALALILLMRK